jgi:hypothetical protein
LSSTFEQVQAGAKAGDPADQYSLSRMFDIRGRQIEGLYWLQRAAGAGHLSAMTTLGARQLGGYGMPFAPQEGIERLKSAAALGGGEACELLAAYVAEGRFVPQSWSGALDLLQQAAELGEPRARNQLMLLTADPDAAREALALRPAPEVWSRARRAIDIEPWLAPPASDTLSQTPRIITIEKFLTPGICDWLIERSRGKLQPAYVYDDVSGQVERADDRNNSNCEFRPIEGDVIMVLVRARIGAAAGVTPAYMEVFSVLHYEVGQRFTPHYDFLDPARAGLAKVIAERGQRVATALVYLNEDFEGAETEFPRLAIKWKGRKGDAILFWNVDEKGDGDRRTLHAGLSPTRGRKWLLSQFIRDKMQPYV